MSRAPLAAVSLAALGFTAGLAGCPSLVAPLPTDGQSEGQPCAADWECGSGLTCECGACAVPGADDLPPRCLDLEDGCNDPPSDCYASCGDETVLGPADCVGGREACSTTEGVLRSQCPAETCWGERGAGEICVDGEWECEFGRATTGECYTFDCTANEESACVLSCGGTELPQVCVAGEWTCESGFPVEDCGGCTGTPPACVTSCDDFTSIGSAICDMVALEWSCSHIVFPDAGTPPLATDCCSPSTVIRDVEDLAALADTTCIAGTLSVLSGTATDVELPALARADGLQVSSNTVRRAAFPALVTVENNLLVESNPLLAELELPVLEEVGSNFWVSNNPQLPSCVAEDVARALGWPDAGPNVLLDNNGPCDGGPPVPDAGPGPDAGPVDAGAVDAGAADAGALDAGPVDGGALDAG